MAKVTRRSALTMLGAGGGLLGLGYAAHAGVFKALFGPMAGGGEQMGSPGMMGPSMMGGGSMMGSATTMDMSTYMDMFNRHNEISRTVEEIPGGVRTTTTSDSPDLVAQLQAHVSAMYVHLDDGAEVTCMSQSLPTLFRRAPDYQRALTFIATGVIAVETARDPGVTRAIRAHAREVSGFVSVGMPAMMQQMMGTGP